MRYLRMLTNAIAGGVLVALYLVVLVLQLNPQVPIVSMTALRWFGALLAFYGPYLSVALYFLILVARGAGVAAAAARLAQRAAARVARRGRRGGRGGAHLGESAAASAPCWPRRRPSACGRARWRRRSAPSCWSASRCCAIRSAGGAAGRRRAAGRVDGRCRSIVPLWLRGPGETPRAGGPPLDASRAPIAHRAARAAAAARRRVARLHPSARRRRPAAELRHVCSIAARRSIWRRSSRRRPSRSGPRRPPASCRRRTASDRTRIYRVERRRHASRSTCCRTTASPTRCVSQGFVRSRTADVGVASTRGRSGTSSPTTASPSGIVELAADVSGATRARGYVLSDRFDEAASSPLRLADAQRGRSDDRRRRRARALRRLAGAAVAARSCRRSRGDASSPTGCIARALGPRLQRHGGASSSSSSRRGSRRCATRGSTRFGHTLPARGAAGAVRRSAPRRSRALGARSLLRLSRRRSRAGDARARAGRSAARRLRLRHGADAADQAPARAAARRAGSARARTSRRRTAFCSPTAPTSRHGQYPRGAIVDLAPTVLYYMGVPVGRDMDGFARTDLFTASYTLEHPVKYVATHER